LASTGEILNKAQLAGAKAERSGILPCNSLSGLDAMFGGTMRVWLACFLVLFGLSELFQWMKQLSLPLPVFILGGAFLAIVSNQDKRAGFPFNLLNQPAAPVRKIPSVPPADMHRRSAVASPSQTPRPISFTIRPSNPDTTRIIK
jgi:hypothetical protein